MTHINDIEELKNIVVLGLDVWLVHNDSELVHILKPELDQERTGLFLKSAGHLKCRVQLLGINDPSFVEDGQYAEMGARIYTDIADARKRSYDVWMEKNRANFKRTAITSVLR